MPTTNKGLNTPARGSFANTWDVPINANFTYIDAIVGATYAAAFTSSNITLSATDALNLRYACTGALGANVALIFPASVGGFWIVANDCTGNFTLSARSGAGAAIVIPQGMTAFITSDGTTMAFADGAAANGQAVYGVDSGAADAYVVTTPLGVSLKAGTTIIWRPTNTNTGASTLEADGTPATAIKTLAGADPIAGALADDGVYISTFDGTVWRTAGLGASNFGLYSADAGASAGPILELYRDSATPAALDATGTIRFSFEDSGGNKTTGATIGGQIISPTDGAETFSVTHYAQTNGALQKEMEVGDGIEIGSPTGGNLGFGTVNAEELYHNGIPVGALAVQTASGSAELDFPSLAPGIYDIYFNNIVLASSGTLVARFSVSGIFITANYSYQVNAGFGSTSSFSGTDGAANGAYIAIASADSAAVDNITGSATLIIGGATAGGTSVNGLVNAMTNGHRFTEFAFGGRNSSSSQVDGIRFLDPAPHNITSGSITLFRRA